METNHHANYNVAHHDVDDQDNDHITPLNCNDIQWDAQPSVCTVHSRSVEWHDLIDLVVSSRGLDQPRNVVTVTDSQVITEPAVLFTQPNDTMEQYWPYCNHSHTSRVDGAVDNGTIDQVGEPLYPFQLFTCTHRQPTYVEFSASHDKHSDHPNTFQQHYDRNMNDHDRKTKTRVEKLNNEQIRLTVHQTVDNVTNDMSIQEALCAVTLIHTQTAHSRGLTLLDTARAVMKIDKVDNHDVLADLAHYM